MPWVAQAPVVGGGFDHIKPINIDDERVEVNVPWLVHALQEAVEDNCSDSTANGVRRVRGAIFASWRRQKSENITLLDLGRAPTLAIVAEPHNAAVCISVAWPAVVSALIL